ncbi:MAG: histidine--tRNA ligase [Candidatus Aenigmarchaeota archaeon ex4484_224]|nr:MAG: histidine--tRNA ligase [Candidatus Aenigmarchaeota archaeon ex4484_224]
MTILPPKGTKDLLPEDAIEFQKLVDLVRSVYEKYGFNPLITPAFESFKLLSIKKGLGEAVKDEIYYFKDKAGRELGLRFDLTMPLARVVANNPQLPKPFKRYQIAKVWRYDNPQRLRYREFWQADIDIVGSESVLADVECLAAVCEILEKIGFKEFFIRVSSRKILEDLVKDLVKKEDRAKVFRIIDKMDKIGREGVLKELEKMGLNGKEILERINFKGKLKDGISFLRGKVEEENLKEIEDLFEISKVYGIDKFLVFDLSLVRGLDYYTSLVYEVYLGEKVSCGGGGRYDDLVYELSGKRIPATGISLGLTRIFEIMKERKMVEKRKSLSKVFVGYTSESVLELAIEILRKIREENISSEIELMGRNLKKQLSYANKMGIRFFVIVGEKEAKENKVRIKDLKTGKEEVVSLNELIKRLKEWERK